MIYSAGWCPICGDGGDLFFLKNIRSGKIFFACDACGCAWKDSPDIEENWEILQPIDLAPNGFSLATKPDIEIVSLAHLIFRNYSDYNFLFNDKDGFIP